MHNKKSKIRKEILEKVKEYYLNDKQNNKEFESGQDVIPFAKRIYDESEMVSLIDASLEFWLTAGDYAKKFEENFAEYFSLKNCLLTNSGSSANLLALTSLTSPKLGKRHLKPGDEVITVAAGFPTTVNPIVQNNLVPVFVDIDLGTYNINIDKLNDAISEKTGAIMLAHTLGNPFNINAVMEIAEKHGLFVIEDVCDAVGSKYNKRLVGTFGDIATVSFYPAHHMTMGEGGAVLTNSNKLANIIRSLRDWGRDCHCDPGQDNSCGKRFNQKFGQLPSGYDHKYVYSHIGYNLKVLDLQPAIGIEQLKKLPGFIKKRKENFKKLKRGLKPFEEFLILPEATEKSNPSWFAFPVTLKEDVDFSRSELIKFLERNKIMTRLLFAGNITRQPAYQNVKFKIVGDLINTDYAMNNTFFIGVYPGIEDEHLNYILKIFEHFFYKRSK